MNTWQKLRKWALSFGNLPPLLNTAGQGTTNQSGKKREKVVVSVAAAVIELVALRAATALLPRRPLCQRLVECCGKGPDGLRPGQRVALGAPAADDKEGDARNVEPAGARVQCGASGSGRGWLAHFPLPTGAQ